MASTRIQLVFMLVCLWVAAGAEAYEYDANDFATEVVEYVAGDGVGIDWLDSLPFTNPNNALGRPTVDTTGDNWNIPVSTAVPVVPVYSPFRSFELVTVGEGGRLVLKFNHPVRDDENNPYGVDFIIFGNSQYRVRDSTEPCYWTNGNPNDYFISGSALSIKEPSVVSVSQDGSSWYSFANGPYADSFAPTLGRVYDPNNYDPNIGEWNLWWGRPTNPTVPLNASLAESSFANLSIASVAQLYGNSAGGSGFDIAQLAPDDYASLATDPNSGRRWIQYIRIEGGGYKPEVDAVSDVSCCGDWKHPFPTGDVTKDCRVNYNDLDVLADYWLHEITGPDDLAETADIYDDDIINLKDFAVMTDNWLYCNWQCE